MVQLVNSSGVVVFDGNIVGTGAQTWYTETTNPDDSFGSDGDFYIVTTTGYIFEKTAGAWAQVAWGVTPGGTAGQVLTKQDEFPGDTEWTTPAEPGLPQGGPLTADLDADGHNITHLNALSGDDGGDIELQGDVTISSPAGGPTTSIFLIAGTFHGITLESTGSIGFFGSGAVTQQTGVAVTAEAIHAALVNLGLITA